MFKFFHKTIKTYVSEIDRFLTEFDKKPEAYSDERRHEMAKAARISDLRDDKNAPRQENDLWKDF